MVGELLPAWLLTPPRSVLESSAGEDALARMRAPYCKQSISVTGENSFNSVFQDSVSPRNSGPLFIICITVAPRGPKLLGFVEHFVGDGCYSYAIIR